MVVRIMRILVVLLLLASSMALLAQNVPLPGTNPLPTTTPDDDPTDDPTITPPPSATPNLPSTAKRGSLMVKQGDREVEWRLSYSHFSRSSLFIEGVAMLPVMVIGEVGVERVRRDVLINSLAFRYGVRDNLQGEIKVPFRYQSEQRTNPDSDPPVEKGFNAAGIGDVEGALYVQLPYKSKAGTRLVGSIGMKSTTGQDQFSLDSKDEIPLGTGFWSTKVGISGVRVVDPAAVFWNVGYTYNWERRNIRIVTEDQTTGDPIVNYVNIKPGNTIDFGGGLAYALNPVISLNTSISMSFNGSSRSSGSKLANTAITTASLRLGAVVLLTDTQPLDISMTMGLTEDSPDFTMEVRRNFRF